MEVLAETAVAGDTSHRMEKNTMVKMGPMERLLQIPCCIFLLRFLLIQVFLSAQLEEPAEFHRVAMEAAAEEAAAATAGTEEPAGTTEAEEAGAATAETAGLGDPATVMAEEVAAATAETAETPIDTVAEEAEAFSQTAEVALPPHKPPAEEVQAAIMNQEMSTAAPVETGPATSFIRK